MVRNRIGRANALVVAVAATLALLGGYAVAQPEPRWPTVEGYPEIDEWLYESQDNPVNEDPEKYIDPEASPTDNWIGNPSYDHELGPVPESERKNPDYLKDGGKRSPKAGEQPEDDPVRGNEASAWPWEWVV